MVDQVCIKLEAIFVKNTNGEWEWIVIAFSDSDCTSDPETRVRIAGFILHFMGVPISWKSNGDEECDSVQCRSRIHCIE